MALRSAVGASARWSGALGSAALRGKAAAAAGGARAAAGPRARGLGLGLGLGVRAAQQPARALATFKYLKSHEYAKLEGGDIVTVGISDFAQTQLGDVVFVDLPSVGDKFEMEQTFGSVESVKAASDVYAPVTGEIVAVNEQLTEKPELVNSHAMSDAWFVKIKMSNTKELDQLLDEKAYEQHVKDEEH
jgi:glycine cleavage system H protein